MTYELAKQLKDAGFPEPERVVINQNNSKLSSKLEPLGEYKPFIHQPTLSELIEACGDKFDSLYRYVESEGERYVWGAHKVGATGADDIIEEKTPEAAVAKLWLALNTKE